MTRLDARMYRLAFLETANPAIITDEDFVIREVNEACLELGGYEREELLGETPLTFFEDASVFEEVADALSGGEPWVGDFEATTSTGRLKHGRGTAAPLVADGETLGYVAIFVDMTGTRQTEESLRILNRVLRHNLRNDANVVLGNLESVRDEVEHEDRREQLDTAIERIEGMLDRAETTRQFGRVLADDGEEALFPVRIGNVVQQSLAKVDTDGADVDLSLPTEPLFAVADETVTAALCAVIDNAVTHGGEDPTIEVAGEYDGDEVVLTVADDGPGIDPERQDRIFGREELSEVHHGEGLSLFFVDRLMTVYGGDVSVEANDPSGSVFELRFRRADVEDAVTGGAMDW